MVMPRAIDRTQLPHEVQATLMGLGDKVSAARRARRWTQADLAAKAGISLGTMSSIERGEPKIQFANWLMVLWALDLIDVLQMAARPEDDSLAQALMEKRLPKRVRHTVRSDE